MNAIIVQRVLLPSAALAILGVTALMNFSMLGLAAVGLTVVLVLIQWAVYASYRKKFAAQQNAPRQLVDFLVLGASLIALYLLILNLAWIDLSGWPSAGSYWDLFVFLAAIGLAFQILMLVSWYKSGQLPQRRLIPRTTAIALGWGLSLGIAATTSDMALARVTERHQALFEGLSGNGEPCLLYADYLENYQGPRQYAPRSLHSSPEYFVLTFLGGSIDIDGSTIVFDSETGQWQVIHNDLEEQLADLEQRQSTLHPCNTSL
jgi:hypothetical protein